MLFFRQISPAAARTVSFALVLGIAIGGAPVAALAGCATPEVHCQKMKAHKDDCATSAVIMSCACDSSAQPANSSSTRAVDLVLPAPSDGPHAYLAPIASGRSLLRPDYRLGRGLLVPLPILHASLLI